MSPISTIANGENLAYKKRISLNSFSKKPNLWIHCSCFMTEHKYVYFKDSCSGKSRIYNNCRLCEGIRLGWSWRYKTQSRAEASLYSDDDTPPFVPSIQARACVCSVLPIFHRTLDSETTVDYTYDAIRPHGFKYFTPKHDAK